MYFKSLSLIALLPLLVTGSFIPVKRLDSGITTDISNVNDDANNLIAAVNAVPDTGATLSEADGVVATAFNLGLGIQSLSNDINSYVASSGQLSHDDSETFLSTFAGGVVPQIVESLGLLTQKRPAFDDLAGIPQSILLDANSINTSFGEFKGAVTAAVPAEYTDINESLVSVEGSIQVWIDRAIAAYST
ncbi:hypothetical protein C8J56DRAFT_980442 [Mycena floridula]|nr:hypothetical protein C8J56DRAFT_980442 [Mycena floridula]